MVGMTDSSGNLKVSLAGSGTISGTQNFTGTVNSSNIQNGTAGSDFTLQGNTIFDTDNQLVAGDFPNATTLYGWNMDSTIEDALAAVYTGTKVGGKNLTVTAAVLQTATDVLGSTGKFQKFQATSYLTYTTDTALDVGAVDFSVVGWFKIPDWSPAARTALVSNTSDGAAHGWSIELSTAGALSANLWGGTDLNLTADVNNLTAATFHHIAFSRTNAGTCALYLDGNLVASGTSVAIGATQQKFQISGYNGANGQMEANSQADEVFYHIGTALTADQVKAIYARSSKKFAVKDANAKVFIPELNVASGAYTPTLTNSTNVAASTAHMMSWIRIGNVVTCNFYADIDPTNAAPTSTALTFTIPIACSVEPTGLSGSASAGDYSQSGRIQSNSATTATYYFWAGSVANDTHQGMFQYVIN